ncbi:TRM11 family SAM-dependent methyltransferase [Niallia taxi]|uniref:TRM11 family SAM-dependent methyltransferase n=1 Tax=Niallia taxi TaxID=2499688 RepID=UPI0037447224
MKIKGYLYTISFHEDETDLCELEMRSLFPEDSISPTGFIESKLELEQSRSPFMKGRVDILAESESYHKLLSVISEIGLKEASYKVVFIKGNGSIPFPDRKRMEREAGAYIEGAVDLQNPEQTFAVMFANGRWLFGYYHKSKSVWLEHQNKPNQYSTALSTRLARAVANIAVPHPAGIKAIDPCCGIGTVLIEALSMGINIVGSDINPLVTGKARENIAHFHLKGEVLLQDIKAVMGAFDVAVIDMPYNLCSVLPYEEKLEMLKSARRFAKKAVIVSIEEVDEAIQQAGFAIVDRCTANKGSFKRHVLVCK